MNFAATAQDLKQYHYLRKRIHSITSDESNDIMSCHYPDEAYTVIKT